MRKAIVCTLAFLSLSACGYAPNPDPMSLMSQSANSSDFEKKLTGKTWARPCAYSADKQAYYIEKIAFSGQDASFQIMTQDFFYPDASCSQPYFLYWTQTFEVNDITVSANGWNVSVTVTKQTRTPMTAAEVYFLDNNAMYGCGLTGWQSGVPSDTTNTSCNAFDTVMDFLILENNQLFRGLDEVALPTKYVAAGPVGQPYTQEP